MSVANSEYRHSETTGRNRLGYQAQQFPARLGIAEESPEKKIRIAASAGEAICYLDGLDLSWSEDEAWGKAPTGICIRTNTLQITNDTQTSPSFALWRERARLGYPNAQNHESPSLPKGSVANLGKWQSEAVIRGCPFQPRRCGVGSLVALVRRRCHSRAKL